MLEKKDLLASQFHENSSNHSYGLYYSSPVFQLQLRTSHSQQYMAIRERLMPERPGIWGSESYFRDLTQTFGLLFGNLKKGSSLVHGAKGIQRLAGPKKSTRKKNRLLKKQSAKNLSRVGIWRKHSLPESYRSLAVKWNTLRWMKTFCWHFDCVRILLLTYQKYSKRKISVVVFTK